MSMHPDSSDSSSDDSVCFGPYTIKEAKKDVRKCKPRKIEQRHSSIFRYRHFDIPMTPHLASSRAEEPLNLSSEYVTSDETARTSYYTAFNEESSSEAQEDQVIKQTVTSPVDASFDSVEDELEVFKSLVVDPVQTVYSILENTPEYLSDDSPENPKDYLSNIIENTHFTKTRDSCQSTDTDSFSILENTPEDLSDGQPEKPKDDLSNMIENTDYTKSRDSCQSTDPDSFSILENTPEDLSDGQPEKPKDYLSNMIENTDYTKSRDSYQSTDPDSFSILENTPEDLSDGPLKKPKDYLSNILENTEYSKSVDSCQSTDQDSVEIIPTLFVTSPVQIPEINLVQLDDSCDFDDTLEEMNRFLEQGIDYVMPEKTTPAKPIVSQDGGFISGSFMNSATQDNPALRNKIPVAKLAYSKTPKMFYSAEKISKPSVEVKGSKTTGKSTFSQSKIKPPSVSAKTLFAKPTKEPVFRHPIRPVKKLTTPNKIMNSALKSVVSPVGLYINHGPKYCPMINVASNKNLGFKLRQPGSSSHKENIPVVPDMEAVPPVVYKPAKTRLGTEVRDVNLPRNIRKLINSQVVTRHEQRIEADACNQSVDRRLLESDLSIDVSQTNQDADISILTHMQPFNLKKF